VQKGAVERKNVEQIQVLALVFVETFYLHVEQRLRIDFDAAFAFYYLGQAFLVVEFYLHKLCLEGAIVGIFFKFAQIVEILGPAFVPYFCVD